MKTLLLLGAMFGAMVLPAQELRPTGIFFIEESVRLVNTVEPSCSQEAIAAQVREVVKVDVQINEQGEPVSLKVFESPGYGLGPKALEAISQWRWQASPEFEQGKQKRIDARIQMSFRCNFLPPTAPAE
ncbi:MAG: TonB family protein [Bryobacterales bacterium]